jgi:tRNA-splicing ligase RtcB
MCAVQTSLTASDLPEDLKLIRSCIERETLQDHTKDLRKQHTLITHDSHFRKLDLILNNHKGITKSNRAINESIDKATKQMGTLGGGNHFIEICLDENQNVWVMLHSGSRGIGNMVGNYFINVAKEEMQKYYITLPDQDLAYFPEGTYNFEEYTHAVQWAQDYAFFNRQAMMQDVLGVLGKLIDKDFYLVDEAINCHHNYVERENHFGQNVWLTRKGAIRARTGDLGIIPGSMGQRSYIVRGKGDCESYHSCSHGAGRAMGRNQATKTFTVEDLVKQTEGVECRKDAGVLDELPAAYKNIDVVMENQKDLVDVVHILKQVLCVKGG